MRGIGVILILGLLALAGVKAGVTYRAGRIADAIWTDPSVTAAPKERQAESVTAHIFAHFTRYGYEPHAAPFWMWLRPVLTSRYLPSLWRVKPGVLETLARAGWCDDAARHLSFVLARRGYDSRQWNMVTPVAGHSALMVFLAPDKPVLMDPYYGYVTRAGSAYLSPGEARTRMARGQSLSRVFVPLGPAADKTFYRDFAQADMHAQGEAVTLTTLLPRDRELDIGNIDGDHQDVVARTIQRRLKPVWDYVGHRYDRAITRQMTAARDTEVSITLTARPTRAILKTLSPPPERVEGNTLIWPLKKGQSITFSDGLAGFMPSCLCSYIPIDQIRLRAHLSSSNKGDTP